MMFGPWGNADEADSTRIIHLTWSPLGGGWLSGRWRSGSAATSTSAARPKARFDMSTEANQRKLEIVENHSYGDAELAPTARRQDH